MTWWLKEKPVGKVCRLRFRPAGNRAPQRESKIRDTLQIFSAGCLFNGPRGSMRLYRCLSPEHPKGTHTAQMHVGLSVKSNAIAPTSLLHPAYGKGNAVNAGKTGSDLRTFQRLIPGTRTMMVGRTAVAVRVLC